MKNLIVLVLVIISSMVTQAQNCQPDIYLAGNEVGYLESDPPLYVLVKNDTSIYNIYWIDRSGKQINKNTLAITQGEFKLVIQAKDKSCIWSDNLIFKPADSSQVNRFVSIRTAEGKSKEEIQRFYPKNKFASVSVKDGKIIVTKTAKNPVSITVFDSNGHVAFRAVNVSVDSVFEHTLKSGKYTIFINSSLCDRITI